MPVGSLRGVEAKEKLVQNYNVTPLVYVRLLEGQTRENKCGGSLTLHYYLFEAENKGTGYKETFYVGDDCGKQLLDLLKIPHDRIRLFDPIAQERNNHHGGENQGGGRAIHPLPAMNNIARELFTAINLIFIYLHNEPFGMFVKILDDITKYPTSEPFPSKLKSVNTYLRNKNLSMSSIIEELRQNNPRFRNYTFNEIKQKLIDNQVIDHDIVF